MDIVSLILSRKYTDNSIKGITGTLAGKNCTIKDITKEGTINTVEFEWTADDGTKRTSQMQVEDGAKGESGVGIESITKISTLGLVDTYQILYTDGNTQNFSVTNGKDGTERVRLTSDGDTIDLDGVPQTFEQVRDLIMDDTKLVTLNLWDNVAFLPSSYNGTAIWFDSGFIMNNTPTQLRVIINDQDEVKVDQIDLARKDEITHKIIQQNEATTERELLELLTSNNYLGYECSGFFYNADIDDYCEVSGGCINYKVGVLTTVYFGHCHIRGLNGNEYYADYYIDNEDKTLWNKVGFNDYIKVSTESGNILEEKSDGLYVGATGVEISQLEDNAIETKTDGLYVKKTSDVEISKDEQNILSKKQDGLFVPATDLTNYVEKENGKSLVSDTDITQITINKEDITSLSGRVTNTESDIDDLESSVQDLTDNKVDKVENKSLVLNTDIEQITTNKDNIGNMNSLVVTSWTDLVSAINALYNGFMQGVSYKDKVLTITYRSGAKFDINLSPIITDTNIGELSNVNDESVINGQALVYDLASKTYKPHTFDLEQVLTDAQTYTDTQLAQHERDIAIACDEKPIYDDSEEKPIIRYKQGGEDKTTENVNTIFYYKVDQNTVQTRWISGVEFTFNVGDVDLSEYVDWDSVVETYTGEETDKTKVPNLKALDALMGIVTTKLSDKINSEDIVDNLLSDDATKVLSAKQGKELKTEVDKKVQIIRVTQAQYDELPDNSTGKQNPSIIWRITDAGVSVNLINDEKVENTSTWSSEKLEEYLVPHSHIGMIIHTTTLDTMEKVIEEYGGTKWIPHSGYVLRGATSGVVAYDNTKTGGEDTHTLTVNEIPSHSHTSGNYVKSGTMSSAWRLTTGSTVVSTGLGSTTSPNVYLDPAGTGDAGGGVAHNNIPNYKSVYIWERVE